MEGVDIRLDSAVRAWILNGKFLKILAIKKSCGKILDPRGKLFSNTSFYFNIKGFY